MGIFDFITGDEFRACLDSDYRELNLAMEAGAWKTVHVLSGSIIEAVLIDYLTACGYGKKAGKDPLKMDLSTAIAACQTEGVLSQKSADLSNVVREYRNLIHPGRVIRLGEAVDANSAKIAFALVDLVVSELATRRKATYGLTAEQVVAKIEKDPSGGPVIEHLLRGINATELGRLLKTALAAKYQAVYPPDPEDGFECEVVKTLANAFRIAFDLAGEDLRREVTQRYVAILKEESGYTVRVYEDAFFRASDLEWMSEVDRELVKKHLLARLTKSVDIQVLDIIERGFVARLNKEDISGFVDPFVRTIVFARDKVLRSRAREVFTGMWRETSGAQDQAISKRLDDWRDHFKSKGNEDGVKIVSELDVFLDVPF